MRRTTIVVLAAALLLTGCAVRKLPPIAPTESVRVAFNPTSQAELELNNRMIGRGAGVGTLGGVVVGAVAGAALCGPFIPICLPAFMAAGGGVGALGGAAAGTAFALDEDKRAEVLARARGAMASPGEELRAAVTEAAARRWPASDEAAATIWVRVDRFRVYTKSGERLLVSLRVSAAVQRGRELSEIRTFEYTSPDTDAALWLDPGSEFALQNLRFPFRQVAYELVMELARERLE